MTQICEQEHLEGKVGCLKKVKESGVELSLLDDLIVCFENNDKDALDKLTNERETEWKEFCSYIDSDPFRELKAGMSNETENASG